MKPTFAHRGVIFDYIIMGIGKIVNTYKIEHIQLAVRIMLLGFT